jgi:hypothetical protein
MEVLDLLRRVEKTGRRETAHRLRGTIGSVCRYAIVTGRVLRRPCTRGSGSVAGRCRSTAAASARSWPVIAELRRITPKGEPPDAKELTGPANDALAAAGIEVAIKPPVLPHGGGHGGPIGKGR